MTNHSRVWQSTRLERGKRDRQLTPAPAPVEQLPKRRAYRRNRYDNLYTITARPVEIWDSLDTAPMPKKIKRYKPFDNE